MFSLQGLGPTQSVNKPCILGDEIICKAIKELVKKYSITNLRECFESYCYTKEKCAVCEEFYSDMINNDNRIDLGMFNVTFCCKRCLFNGWIDVVNYLKARQIYVCMHPCCLQNVGPNYALHFQMERSLLEAYVRNELDSDTKECSDPLCKRLGFDQTESLNLEDSGIDLSILDEFTTPKLYCCRKHAIATKMYAQDSLCPLSFKPLPTDVSISVNCHSQMSNSWNELHNTYPYSPIFFDDKWYHTLFHAIAYLMHIKDSALGEEIRKTTSVSGVVNLLTENPLGAEYQDDILFDLETKLQQLLTNKFIVNVRMFQIALFHHKASIKYNTCIPDLEEPDKFNKVMSSELSKFTKELYEKVAS